MVTEYLLLNHLENEIKFGVLFRPITPAPDISAASAIAAVSSC